MKRPFVIGIAGGLLGIAAAVYVIASAQSPSITLSGVQAVLFFALGLMAAALIGSEPRLAAWMFISSALWIVITSPITGTPHILLLYIVPVILLTISAVLTFREPVPEPLALAEETAETPVH
ncbi:MAG: hypothetical protein WC342_08085 [Methanoregula sp.]|jgi:hypothetical protein